MHDSPPICGAEPENGWPDVQKKPQLHRKIMEIGHLFEEERHFTLPLLWNDESRLLPLLGRSDAEDLPEHDAHIIRPEGIDLGFGKIPDLEGKGLLFVTLLNAPKNLGGADPTKTSMEDEIEVFITRGLDHSAPGPTRPRV